MRSEWLYFGATKPDGRQASEAEWESFLGQVVTPRFPDGLTVLNGKGQWKGKTGEILAEKSYILNIVHIGKTKQNQAFAEIVVEYKRRFGQESVLQVSTAACAGF